MADDPAAVDLHHPPAVDPELLDVLDRLADRRAAVAPFDIGFPAATDIDYTPLTSRLAGRLLNNLGDPTVEGLYPHHTKRQEREAIGILGDLLHAPAQDRWGYIAGGASEGTEYALLVARSLYPDAIAYHSAACHDSVPGAIHRLGMRSVTIRVDAVDEIDYDDLAAQIDRRRDRPAVVVANAGTPMREAVDDVRHISAVLDQLAVRRRFVHVDAALAGLPLATVSPRLRPGFDFDDGADSVVLSGHKFPGTPLPCAAVIVRDSRRRALLATPTYTGSPNATVACSRSGLAVLAFWFALKLLGVDGLRRRAAASRDVAAYAHQRLVDIGWDAHRHPLGFTVCFPDPRLPRWPLAAIGGWSHLIAMPGVTREHVDAFLADALAHHINGATTAVPRQRTVRPVDFTAPIPVLA